MLGITPGFPVLGMGVFTGILSSAALPISTICIAVAEGHVFIPRKSSAFTQIVATPSLLIA